ncbi:hypothetical protein D9M68_758600 [compost metagenome]
MMSEALLVPGNIGTSLSRLALSNSAVEPGVTMNCAPASSAAASICRSSTVPAPTQSSGRCSRSRRMAVRPWAERRVISSTLRPPAARASANGRMSASRAMVITGMIRARAQRLSIWAIFAAMRVCWRLSLVVISAGPSALGAPVNLKGGM